MKDSDIKQLGHRTKKSHNSMTKKDSQTYKRLMIEELKNKGLDYDYLKRFLVVYSNSNYSEKIIWLFLKELDETEIELFKFAWENYIKQKIENVFNKHEFIKDKQEVDKIENAIEKIFSDIHGKENR